MMKHFVIIHALYILLGAVLWWAAVAEWFENHCALARTILGIIGSLGFLLILHSAYQLYRFL